MLYHFVFGFIFLSFISSPTQATKLTKAITEFYKLTKAITEFYKPIKLSYNLPKKIDFRQDIPYIHDQGKTKSCVIHAVISCMEFSLKTLNPKSYLPLSPLFVYYNARKLDGNTPHEDAGATVSGTLKAVSKYGACNLNMWSFSEDNKHLFEEPSKEAYENGLLTVNLEQMSHNSVSPNLTAIQDVLAKRIPVIFNIRTFGSFAKSREVYRTGNIPLPLIGEKRHDSHAMVMVGYDDEKRIFYVANSWGVRWGDNGFCTIPYDYIASPQYTLFDDFHKIEDVGSKF